MNKREQERRIKRVERCRAELTKKITEIMIEYAEYLKDDKRNQFDYCYATYENDRGTVSVCIPPNYECMNEISDIEACGYNSIVEAAEAVAENDVDCFCEEAFKKYINFEIDEIYIDIEDYLIENAF